MENGNVRSMLIQSLKVTRSVISVILLEEKWIILFNLLYLQMIWVAFTQIDDCGEGARCIIDKAAALTNVDFTAFHGLLVVFFLLS